MKVPARRRGNSVVGERARRRAAPLNESPRPNAGKFARRGALLLRSGGTSMKVPARRRRNRHRRYPQPMPRFCLNESPHPKTGKWILQHRSAILRVASMKVSARMQENKSIPKQPFKHLNTIDKPKHHASDTPRLRHVPGSRGDRQSLQRPLSPPLLPVRNRTRHSSAPLPRVASE